LQNHPKVLGELRSRSGAIAFLVFSPWSNNKRQANTEPNCAASAESVAETWRCEEEAP